VKTPEKLDAPGQGVPSSRQRILEVATALFASNGYAGVGMREVADRSGLSKSALFHHFATKLSLYGAVRIAILDDLEARLVAAGPVADDPMAQLERWLDAVIDALAERPHAAPLLLRSLFEDEPLEPIDAEHSAATLGRILSRGRDALRIGMQSGRFRRVSVSHTMQSIIGMLVFHFASGVFGDQMLGHSKFAPDQVQARKEHVRAVLHGLLSLDG
jgi:AcrR family transcriptional regulator